MITTIRNAPPTLEWVAVDRLAVDPAYQRATDTHASRRIIGGMVKCWDWALCQPLVVARRSDGSLFILDGQHRWEGASQRGDVPHLPCVILSNFDHAAEAETFVALNTKRQRLSQTDLFNAMLAAGDETAKQTATIIAETGWKIARGSNAASYGAGYLACAPMLANAARVHGPAVVRNALTTLREAYPDTAFNTANTMLKALIAIYRDDDLSGGDPDLFIEMLGSVSPDTWIEGGRDYRRHNRALSHIEALAAAMVRAFVDYAKDRAA
ncbi:MAG: hypothetical protein ACK40C_09150 [Novosphingobium meiothermophilum]